MWVCAIYTHIYVCACMCIHTCTRTHACIHKTQKDSLLRVASFLPPYDPGVWTRAIRLGDKHFGFEPPHQVLNILISQFSLSKFIFPNPPHPLLLGTVLRIFTVLGKPSTTLQENLSYVFCVTGLWSYHALYPVSLEECSTFHSAMGL